MSMWARLKRLEKRAAALLVLKQRNRPEEEAFEKWFRRGCKGSFPPAGPRPVKFANDEEWQKHHRLLLSMACVSTGRDLPPGMTEAEYHEVEDTVAFFASIDPVGRLSLPARAELAPYAETIKVFLSGPANET